MSNERKPVEFCLPSSAALMGQGAVSLTFSHTSPYDIEFPLPILGQPSTQPTSPRFNHRSPSPHRYKNPIPISIENYNPRKKVDFTEKYTLEAISLLHIDKSQLFINPQYSLEEQNHRISILKNEVRQVRNRLRSTVAGQKPLSLCKPSVSALGGGNRFLSKNRIFDSRLECVKERNKRREKKAGEIAQRMQEEQQKRQEKIISQERTANKRIIETQLQKKRRSTSTLSPIDVSIVPIVF